VMFTVALDYFISTVSNSEALFMFSTMGCKRLELIRVVLSTRLRVSFNAYVDPLYKFQVIYRALTLQLTTE
jgi:hypothetical protein